jgi:hypothetical protein
MAEGPREAECPTREWQAERFADCQFTHLVPAAKWGFFTGRVRPLADKAAAAVWDALFAGVGRPFHYKLAAGWMGQVFRRVRSKPSDVRGGQSVDEALVGTLGWAADAAAYLVFPGREVYAAGWAGLLDCFRRGWVPLDTLVVCGEASDRVALFWEGFGPYFAHRGERALRG